MRQRPTVCVIRMNLLGTWHGRILSGDTAAGALKGRERLGGPKASMGPASPLRYLVCLRNLIWDGESQSPNRYLQLTPKNPRPKQLS